MDGLFLLLAVLFFLGKLLFGKNPPQKRRPEGNPEPYDAGAGTQEEKLHRRPRLAFEIPKLKGAPKPQGILIPEMEKQPRSKTFPAAPLPAAWEETAEELVHQAEEEHRAAQRREEERILRERERQEYERATKIAKPPERQLPRFRLTPESAQQAVVLAEILGRPKGLRKPFGRK